MNQTYYQRSSDTISGALHDQIVMMDIKRGTYYSLNTVATRIWELLEQTRTAEALCEVLVDEFDVEPSQCHQEVMKILAEMQKLNLVSMSHGT